MTPHTVRTIGPDEWPAYRELRLRALLDSPDAFGSSHALESARPDALWAERLAGAATSGRDLPLFAHDGGTLVGLAWCKVDAADPRVADLFQMWVAPEARGRGTGAALLDACIRFSRARRVQRLRLGVTDTDSPAMRLYRRAGFVPDGEPLPLRDGSPLLARLLVLELTTP